MNIRKRTILTYSMLAVSAVLAAFFFFTNQRIKEELGSVKLTLQKAEKQNLIWQKLTAADSLLLAGRYSEAYKEYGIKLNENDSIYYAPLNFRRTLAERLISLRRQISRATDSLEAFGAEKNNIHTLTPLATSWEIRQYDSLLYALEKANVQMEHLQNQLRQRTAGTYLTFPSRKGNPMHYVGEVRNGKANGKGIALLTTGSRYVGEWKENMRHGQGAFYWPDGEYYEGSYRNDRRSGQGTYYWPTGEKFIGEWENDERNGQGTYYGQDGEVEARGIWKNDELVEVENN